MSASNAAPVGAIVEAGIVQSLVYPHPDDHALEDCFPPGVVTPIPAGAVIAVGMTWDGKSFGPIPPPPPVQPRVRTATTWQLMSGMSAAMRAAYGSNDPWDQRLFSARDTPWPEDDAQIARMAGSMNTTPAAWFDAALAPAG